MSAESVMQIEFVTELIDRISLLDRLIVILKFQFRRRIVRSG